ncbi:MAG: serine/threonine protein kinase [Planctomycetaceae bacterium]|nr:serine/threonine protein kinase [Planctomycetaceae bacterium]
MAPRQIGPFILERQIGVGGMGIVYSAIYPANGKKVALKVLSPGLMADPKLLKRFEREIEILKRLDHPNIVKYYGGGTENNQRYYAMEYIDGGSLQDVLKKRGRLTWEQAIHVGRQVSAALEHAHNAGIIHRDLKPANLFLSKKGRLKLGDFGIARDNEATALTAAGKTVGTYAYMAPEQIQTSYPITGKTDLYALGCVLYEVLVGETPFQSENPMDMLLQHLKDDPYNVIEKVPDCPIWLDQLIERLLAKNPDDRPHDALAVHTELGEIREKATSGTSVALDTSPPVSSRVAAQKAETNAPPKKKKKKKKDVPFHEQTWFLVLCLVVLIGATVWMMLPPGEDWYAKKWRDAMRGDEYAQRAALEEYLDPYLTEFPEGQYVTEARELSDTLHAYILEPQLKNLARIDKPVEPPFKARCVAAAKLERDEGLSYAMPWEDGTPQLTANPLPTMQRWKELLNEGLAAKDADDEFRWLTQVCENHHEFFRQKLIESADADSYLRSRCQQAEELLAAGDKATAIGIWGYLASEFQKVEKFQPFYEYARQRFNLIEAPIPLDSSATAVQPPANPAS